MQLCCDTKESKMSEKIKFMKEKETKNTVRYKEVPAEGKPPLIGTLYVQQWFAADKQELTVTIDG